MAIPDESGPSTPSWIKDDESVEVDINRLEDFALRMRRELELNFAPSFEHGIMPNLKALARRAPFGKGGLPEGIIFSQFHAKNLEAITMMAADVQKSLMAISLAAQSIAAEYSTGDAMSKATLDDVSEAFAPTEANVETMSGLIEKGQQGGETKVDGHDVQIPESVQNDQENDVPPADLSEPGGDGNDVRGEETIGDTNKYYIPGDSEGVEVRKPQDEIPR